MPCSCFYDNSTMSRALPVSPAPSSQATVAFLSLLANLATIFVTLMGWLLWKERVTRVFLVGMVTALVGMFVLVGPHFGIGGTQLLGDALGALTAVFYGSYMLAIKRARDAQASTA